jgi:hypothetical protein
MKKNYLKPAMCSVILDQRMSILESSSLDAHNKKGSDIQFSRNFSSWDDDEE